MLDVQRMYFGPRIDSGDIRPEQRGGGVPTLVASRAGGSVFTNGVVSNDPETGAIVAGAIRVRARRGLETLRGGLERTGTDLDHVVPVRSSIGNMDDRPAYREVCLELFDEHRPPPGFTVATDLAAPELIVEGRMIAAIRNG